MGILGRSFSGGVAAVRVGRSIGCMLLVVQPRSTYGTYPDVWLLENKHEGMFSASEHLELEIMAGSWARENSIEAWNRHS